MAFNGSPSSQHQDCTDEAQKAETVLSAVLYARVVLYQKLERARYEVQSTLSRIKSYFPYKDSRGQMAKIVYKAACWDCNDFYIGKTKRRLHDRKTEHFKALINGHHTSALADHVTSTGHNLKWDHFEVLAKGRSDTHCKIKETLLIQDLKPTLNEYVSSERLSLLILIFFYSFLSPLLLLIS